MGPGRPAATLSAVPVDRLGAERRDAQRLACRHLISGCERALAELRTDLGRASTPVEIRVGLEAAEMLENILTDWRSASVVLEEADEAPSGTA